MSEKLGPLGRLRAIRLSEMDPDDLAHHCAFVEERVQILEEALIESRAWLTFADRDHKALVKCETSFDVLDKIALALGEELRA